jgi:hypothetical protein
LIPFDSISFHLEREREREKAREKERKKERNGEREREKKKEEMGLNSIRFNNLIQFDTI